MGNSWISWFLRSLHSLDWRPKLDKLSLPSLSFSHSHSPLSPSFYYAALRQIAFHWTANETLSYLHCCCNKTFLSPLELDEFTWAEQRWNTTSETVNGDTAQARLFTERWGESLYIHWLSRRKLPLNPAKEAGWLMTQQEVALTLASCLKAGEDVRDILHMCPIFWAVTEC